MTCESSLQEMDKLLWQQKYSAGMDGEAYSLGMLRYYNALVQITISI